MRALLVLWRDARIDLERLWGSDPATWHPRDIAERGYRLVHIEGTAYRARLVAIYRQHHPVGGGPGQTTETTVTNTSGRLSPSQQAELDAQQGR